MNEVCCTQEMVVTMWIQFQKKQTIYWTPDKSLEELVNNNSSFLY